MSKKKATKKVAKKATRRKGTGGSKPAGVPVPEPSNELKKPKPLRK